MPPTPGPSSLKRSASEPDDALRDLKKSKREEKEKKKRRKKKRKTSVVQALRPTSTPAPPPADGDDGDEERSKNKGKGRAISSELLESPVHAAGDQLTGVIASASTSPQVQTPVEIARSRAKRSKSSAGGHHRTLAPPLADDDSDDDDDEPKDKGKGRAADSEHPRAEDQSNNVAVASTPHPLALQDPEIDRFRPNGDEESDDKEGGGVEDVESPESPMQVENQLTTLSITPSDSAQAEAEDDERPKDKGKGRATGSGRPETPTRTENQLTNLIIASTSHRPSTSAHAEAQAAEIARLRTQLAEQTNLVQRHETHLASMQNSLTCQICLDLLYKPYTLSPCGHIACYACLLRWFTTNPNQAADTRFDPEAIVNGPLVPAAPAPAAPAEPAGRPGRHRHFHFHRRPPTAVRQYLHKRKTCPLCRAVVRNRPTEVYTVKEMVGGLSRSLLVELPVPAPAPTPPNAGAHPGNPTNDPWNNVFPPIRNTYHDDDYGYEYHGIDYFMDPVALREERMALATTVRGAMAEAERRGRAAATVPAAAEGDAAREHPADPNDMGMRDMSDGGIYRCWDCMHELWGRVCSGCGRVYTGHQPEDEDEDNSDDDYGLGARVRELEDLEFDLTDEEGEWGDHHPFEDDEDDHGDPYAALYEEVHRLEPVPLNRHEELEWLRALVPVGRGPGGRVRNGQIIEALRALGGEDDEDEDDEVIFDEPDDDDSDMDHVMFEEAMFDVFNGVGRRNRRNPAPAQGQGQIPGPGPVPHVIVSDDEYPQENGGRNGRAGRAARDRAVLHALVAARRTRGNRNAPGPADENPEGMADVWDGAWGDVEVEEVNSDDEPEANPAVPVRRRGRDVVVIGSDSGGEESDEEVRHVPPPRVGRRRARQEVVEIGSDSEYEGSFIDDDGDDDAGGGRIRRRREPSVIVVDEDEDEDDEDRVGLDDEEDEDEDEEDGSEEEDGIAATFALLNQTRGRERSGPRPPIAPNSRFTRSSAASSSRPPAVIISSDEDEEEEEDRPRRRNGRASGSRQTNLQRRSRRPNPIHDDSDEEDEVKEGLESVETETGPPSVVVVGTDTDSEPGIPAPPDKDEENGGEATAVEEGEKEAEGEDKEGEEDLAQTIASRRARMAKAAEKRRAGG